MAKKRGNTDQTTEVFENVEQSLTKAELFFEQNRNPLLIAAAVILGVALLYYVYAQYIVKPQEEEAQEMIFMAQKYFEQDSLKLALNGDGPNMGFIDIADEYSSTKAGNLASYYAGVCYLNLGDFENAIIYLDEFSGDDEIISVVAKGAIGDAFLELNQPEEALEYYTTATKVNKNEFVIPIYLQKAAQTAEILNDYKGALRFYERIKKEFPESREASDIDKQITYIQTKLNQ
jgi:tetratricopeptide (TPR) repeat protein